MCRSKIETQQFSKLEMRHSPVLVSRILSMGLYTKSKPELDHLALIRRIVDRHISVVTASELMGLSRSQVHRLVEGYRQSGANALILTRRGEPGNRSLPAAQRELALAPASEHYGDFGPTLPEMTFPLPASRHLPAWPSRALPGLTFRLIVQT